MRYHNIVGQLAKENAASCLLAFCFIFFLLSSLYFLCYVEGVEDDPFKSKNFQKFNFVTAGDFGCGDEPNRTIEGMVKKTPELTIALGDLSYNKSALCWLYSVIPLEIEGTVKITFGDHDLTTKMIKYNNYLRHFDMTKPFYSFDYQNVHFLAMATAKNSIIPYQNGSDQYNFIQEDLVKAHNNKSIDWIIVYTFRPLYSSVTEHYGEDILAKTYHRLFDKYGVDIVLQAHNHNYQRTLPLRYNESSFSPLYHPIIADKHTAEYKDPNGTIFLTVGTGGAELHNFTGKAPYIAEQFESHGFLNVDMASSKKELTLLGTFYENTDMNKKDHFSITKQK
jgi:Calcineurin-like phosphoesterase